MTDSPLVPLTYALPRRKRRMILLRRIGLGFLVVFLAGASVDVGAPLVRQFEHRRALARAYSLQQRCMSFSLPAGTPVYVEGQGGLGLADRPGFRLEMTGAEDLVPDGRWGPFFCATYHPDCWTDFQNAQAALAASPAYEGRCVVFLHERHSLSGGARLVMVEFCPVRDGWFRCNVIVPGTSTSLANPELTTTVLSVGRSSDTDLLQVMAGQPDPANSSHFTLGCRFNGKPCTIDGVLRSDDRVTLRPRSGTLELNEEGAYWWPEGRPAKYQ